MRQNWQLWEGALSDEQCDTFEDMCKNYPSYNDTEINNCTIDVDVPKTMIIGKKFYDSFFVVL